MNLPSMIVGLAVLAAAGLAVRKIIRDKKRGKSACSGDCSHCSGCH